MEEKIMKLGLYRMWKYGFCNYERHFKLPDGDAG